jgi:hypothetical protein
MAGMKLSYFYGIMYLLGAVGLFILAPIQRRAGKMKYFWAMLVLGIVLLVMAISNL